MSERRLLVFTRRPTPGRAKTRLIPMLGAEGAAALQTRLNEHTLSMAARAAAAGRIDWEVWLAEESDASAPVGVPLSCEGTTFAGAGASVEAAPPRWRTQVGEGLGERLTRAVDTAFAEGARKVVVIGADCPDLDERRIAAAFEQLRRVDGVVGPALDGGYYLIGLRRPAPALFHDIPWGTSDVLDATLRAARRERLAMAQLPPLGDVDHPEDLLACRRHGLLTECSSEGRDGLLSIIVPTKNEESQIERTLSPLVGRERVEVLVADGGSSDRTCELAERSGARVLRVRGPRGCQLNAGAALARGATLLFLHADTRLPEDFREHVDGILAGGAVAGAFRLRIDGAARSLRWVEWGVDLRSRWRRLPYGDQALFLSAETFLRLGGFRAWPLLEDYELVRRLRRAGRVELADAAVTTSARRWERLGWWRTTLRNQWCLAKYHLGVPVERLAAAYRR